VIIREYLCRDCGNTFESSDAVEDVACPVCTAQDAERVFLTPPSIKSPTTSNTDRTLQTLAADYGLSDMSNRDGAAVKRAPSGPAAPQFTQQTPQMAQVLGKLGANADGFSGVLPTLRSSGGPRNWAKERLKT
jgi:putative FmdB family regulatory protein